MRVTPGARTTEIVGWDAAGTLVVRVAAPPVEGKANAELIAALAKGAGIPKSHITVARGAGSRLKMIAIDGVTPDEFRRRLESRD